MVPSGSPSALMRTGQVGGVSSLMSGEEYGGFEQKVTKDTKEEDRSCWGVEVAWLAATTVGLAQAREGGSIRASPLLRILRYLRCLLFKNPIQLLYRKLPEWNEAFSVLGRSS